MRGTPQDGSQGPERRRERRRQDDESGPAELSEQQDPVQDEAEVCESEDEAESGAPPRSSGPHQPQEGYRGQEGDPPEVGRG
jgi:hypothetical protein